VDAIGTTEVTDESLTGADISDGSIAAADLGTGSVTTNEILDGTIGTADVGNGAVTAAKLAADAAIQTIGVVGGSSVAGTGTVSFEGTNGIAISADNSTNTITFDGASPSSIRWKEAVRTLEDPMRLVEQLRGVRYTWTESGEADVGVIAEEVAEVLPEVVAFEDDGQARGVNYGKLVSVLIEAAKAQQQDLDAKEQTIQTQRDRIDSQQAEIDALKDRMDRLERLVKQSANTSSTNNRR
jgi:polyhydroxyalkanoate synthesis regulator phasin